ncbi:MAG: hypothetical protein CM15mP93_16710 [Thiotrichaceae bacterium]|nr:MAG: hypothetical protein CM15mP93_16710 [Thiotrichaceae bacterium]
MRKKIFQKKEVVKKKILNERLKISTDTIVEYSKEKIFFKIL